MPAAISALNVWCAGGTSLVQSLLGALVVSGVGLLIWPFKPIPKDRATGPQADTLRSRELQRLGRLGVFFAVAFIIAAVGLYLTVFSRVGGKTCNAKLSGTNELLVWCWLATAASAVVLVTAIGTMRLRTEQLRSKR